MKTIMIMFDSLNRHLLPPYGCDWVHAPNFQRLAARSVTFDHSYVGSMPCMPARRELHTGRYNFLHRSWGPLEPFDDSMPQILGQHGVHSHLCSDHYHYWEDGGATYHNRYGTWEGTRGQEGDPWICDLTAGDPQPANLHENQRKRGARCRQDFVNRRHIEQDENRFPQIRTFNQGLRFLETNHAAENWFLQIETFDPHEPYHVPERFKTRYGLKDRGVFFDWPLYGPVTEPPELVEQVRRTNAALIGLCDEQLGRVLDFMDAHDLWRDTLLIVNTDHGFLLGEHDCWAKCWAPFYNEVAHTPLWIWDPREGRAGERRQALVQTIDLAPTVLEFFGVDRPADMQGVPLRRVVRADSPVRGAALFGMHGGHVNITDGRYVYMRAPVAGNAPLYEYTHMPTHMGGLFSPEEMRAAELAPPFRFTKGCPVMRIPARQGGGRPFRTMLFDLDADPEQRHERHDPAVEARLVNALKDALAAAEAPREQFTRLGLA